MKNGHSRGVLPVEVTIAEGWLGAAPDVPSLAELLRETADFLTDYIVFPMPAHAPIVALWIGHT